MLFALLQYHLTLPDSPSMWQPVSREYAEILNVAQCSFLQSTLLCVGRPRYCSRQKLGLLRAPSISQASRVRAVAWLCC